MIELDPVTVPGTSEDLFPEQWVELDEADRDRWVRAIEFLPGDRRVTHHFLATYNAGEKGATGRGQFETGQGNGGTGIFTVWTAGMQPYEFPAGMGRLVGPTHPDPGQQPLPSDAVPTPSIAPGSVSTSARAS